MVDRIDSNIKQSCNYVEKAKDNVEKAVTYQQKARKVGPNWVFDPRRTRLFYKVSNL